jgi:hypothetical protein
VKGVDPTAPGHLFCLFRTKGGYLYQTRSEDAGESWSPSEPSPLPAPESMARMIPLQSGHLLVVWNNVSSYSGRHNVDSNTSCLSDFYNTKEKDFEAFLNKFTVKPEANALALFAGKRLMSIDAFGLSAIYEEYFHKLLKGAALETFAIREGENELNEPEACYEALSFLDKFEEIESNEHKGAGAGIEERFNSEELTGFELSYNNNLIHLTALAKRL